MATDSRIDRLEAEVSQVGQRVAALEGEVRQMNERLTSLENTMNSRFSSLESRVTTMWISTMGMIAAGVIALVIERLISK
jgi:predicted nuclease with TOPRIM domain